MNQNWNFQRVRVFKQKKTHLFPENNEINCHKEVKLLILYEFIISLS